MSENFNFFLPLSKAERQRDGSVLVSGYCSTPTLDMDDEIVSLDAIRKALPGYWAWRNIRQMHQSSAVGIGKEANVDANGCFLTAKITDKEAAQKCLDGVYKGFSIGGRKLAKQGNTITEIDWVETSIVDRPANPECKFDVAKKAKDAEGAFLVKLPKQEKSVSKDLAKALKKMAEVSEFLVKADNPPAAHDGFSLPVVAKVATCSAHDRADCPDCKCAAHGTMDCAACKEAAAAATSVATDDDADDAGSREDTQKRNVGRKERSSLANSGDALPDGSFPIKNKGDLADARQAIGRSKNPGAARALIRRRARELGVSLPAGWKKKLAKSLIADAESILRAQDLASSSFLTLSAKGGGGVAKGARDFAMSLESELTTLEEGARAQRSLAAVIGQETRRVDGQGFLTLGGTEMTKAVTNNDSGGLEFNMENISDPGERALLDLIKRAAVPSRAARLGMAKGDLKKARGAAKDLEECIKAAHGMHKAAYLAKAAGKKKPDPDGDAEFDHQGAMEKLQKAFSDLQTVKTMMKSAGGQLKKAMSRSGQRGQEVSDGNADYQVPAGIKDLSPGEIDTAGGSSPPFVHGMETPFPGKSAKAMLAKFSKDGKISVELAEMLSENAALAAQVEALGKLPAGPVFGKKPTVFDMTKIVGGTKDDPSAAVIMKGVDPADITKDEQSNSRAIAKMIGNMIVGGQGKSVFETDFHGTGGLG